MKAVRSWLGPLVLLLALQGVALHDAFAEDFEAQGIQEGQQIPDLVVYTLDGQPRHLSELWAARPVLLVTGSLTCDISRRELPDTADIATHFGDRLSIVVLYVIEPHPWDEPSPYTQKKHWWRLNNIVEGIFRRQPLTLDERAHYARELIDRIDLSVPVMLDSMNNEGWDKFGGGPNMALLIGRDGVLVEKQGWFDDATMQAAIVKLLAH